MPIPKPGKQEEKGKFISRCMGDTTMNKEYPDQKQRAGVCYTSWKSKHKTNMEFLETNSVSVSRTASWQGAEYLVLPTIILTEGVHNGLLYTAEELAKFPSAWDGRPIPIYHPKKNDVPVSCNSPDVLGSCIGQVFNTKFEDKKLKAELWVHKEKLLNYSPELVPFLEAGNQMDVSTALWSEDINEVGVWNGEQYFAKANAIRPDHVALLPNEKGACSLADGCGVNRINKEDEPMPDDEKQTVWQKIKGLLKFNELGHNALRNQLRELVRGETGSKEYASILEVYNKYFVYSVEPQEGGAEHLFRRDYTVDKSGMVSIDNEKIPVMLKTEFTPITNEETPDGDQIQTNMEGEEDMPNEAVKKLVDGLIANEATQFVEEDREFLQGLTECQLKKMAPVEKEPPVVNKDKKDDPPATEQEPVKPVTLSEVLASKEFVDAIGSAVNKAMGAQDRQVLVNKVKEIPGQTLTDEELATAPTSILEMLVKSNSATNFAGRGGAVGQQQDDGVPEMPKILSAGPDDKKGKEELN